MWYVYNKQDHWSQGYEVASESEAIEICKEDTEMTYRYIDEKLIA